MENAATDPLSALAHQVLKIDYGQAYSKLVTIGPGRDDVREVLSQASPDALVAGGVANLDYATGVMAGLYLWHDCLEESHRISQASSSETGSFWHAIMHRREGDFSNSKYWYARCASHPAMGIIANRANAILNPLPADKAILKLTLGGGGWNPNAFVDFVSAVAGNADDPKYEIAVELQRVEWQMLFDYCARMAAKH